MLFTKERMMLDKPLYLKLYPILALGIALSFPIQIMHLYQIPFSDMEKLFSMLTPMNILTMVTLIASAILTFTLHKYVYKVIPILLLVIFSNNAIVGLYGTDYTVIQVAMSFVLFGLSLKPLYNTEIKAVIYNPELRWWLTPKRYSLEKQVQLNSDILDVYSDTVNVSVTGVFAKIADASLIKKLPLNSIIDVKLMADNPIPLKAKIVRVTSPSMNQPLGCGLEIVQDENYKTNYLPWFKSEIKA